MAITSGAGPHAAWINGILIAHGTVVQNANRKSSTFSVTVPMFEPGALAAFSGPGDATIVVQNAIGISGPLITGEIDTIDLDYIGTTIHISGRDKSAKLHAKKSAEKWQNKPGSEIVKELAGRAGLGAGKIDSSQQKAGKKLEQDFVKLTDSVSLATVIHLLGQFDGARWYVDKNGNFNYQQVSGSGGGSYSVFYKPPPHMVSDALALRVKLNCQAMKGAKVTVKSWHPKDKKLYTGQSQAGGGGGGGGDMNEYVYHIPTLDQEHADQHARSRAKEHSRHAIEVVATVIGDPSIDVSGTLNLSGTGFDGSYTFDNIHHAFGMGGYTMTMHAKSSGGNSGEGAGGGAGGSSSPEGFDM